jgi:adenine-specific DNA-methyltransferase
VDKEDLERHDKWLCMMWPRLVLLRELLSEKGSIWITLDDNEAQRFKIILDEIFGENNFVTSCLWQKVFSPKNTAQYFSEDHDYILVYAKNKVDWRPNLLDRTDEMEARYSNPDNDPNGPWTSGDLSARNFYSEGTYSITCPSGRVISGPPKGTYWRVSKENFEKLNSQGKIWWGADGDNQPRLKRYLSEVKEGRVPQTLWLNKDVGHTQDAKKELLEIMEFDTSNDVFITPKPSTLIDRVIELATDIDSVVLDSFAGSGTTAHSVLKSNFKDNGNRKFILIECEDYADTLTAERVRRVINGYPFSGIQRDELLSEKITWSVFEKKQAQLLEKIAEVEGQYANRYDKIKKQINDGVLTVTGERKIKDHAPGIGGSFTYCTLGEPIQIESLLTGEDMPSFEALARYVFYTATGKSLESVAKASVGGFIGETDLFRIHLFYQPDSAWLRSNEAALNSEKVKAILGNNPTRKRTLVFAVAKFMSQKELTAQRIEFCQLPYAIHRIMGA